MAAHSFKLCVIIPYFGKWPSWMPFFLRSCELNPSVRWVLVSDCGRPPRCPANVTVRETTFEQYCAKISSRLKIDFAPTSAYKLCDLKPALGEVHDDELEAASHWAFGDIDVIYGRLEQYLCSRDLARYDVLALHARRLSGHLTVLRNTAEINSAFRRVANWDRALEDPAHRAFDEKAFSKVFLRHKNSPGWVRRAAQMLDPWLARADFQEAYTTPNAKIAWMDGTMDYPKRWYWRNGVIWNDRDDKRCYPYLHFMNWKKTWPDLGLFDPELVRDEHALWIITDAGIAIRRASEASKV